MREFWLACECQREADVSWAQQRVDELTIGGSEWRDESRKTLGGMRCPYTGKAVPGNSSKQERLR